MWAKLDEDIVWESNDVERLWVTIDTNLRFDKHVSDICLKASRKLSALTRVAPFRKRLILFEAFIETQFKYCPLVWMFHGRQTIVYNDTVTSFENLLIKDKSFTIHHQNIQLLAIEIYKAIHNLPGGNLGEFFARSNHNYNLRSESEQLLANVSTVLKDKILLVISDQ